jgi:2-polyprenyl-3-methyl-5-hydroxy-6-metoxy-1,4-benzoquinol methylase
MGIQNSRTIAQRFRNHLLAPLRLTVLSDEQCRRSGVTSINEERIAFARQFVRGRLLDVGCGHNRLVSGYSRFGVGVDVFDWSAGALILRDTSRLPFLDRTFDTVTILAALNHIPNRRSVLTEVKRVLRDDGRVVLTMITPRLSAIGHRLLWWYGEDWARGMADGEVYGFTPHQVRALMSDAGFTLERHTRFLYRLNHLYVFRKQRDADESA